MVSSLVSESASVLSPTRSKRVGCATTIAAAACASFGLWVAAPRIVEDKILETPPALALFLVGCAGLPLCVAAALRLRRSTPRSASMISAAFVGIVGSWFAFALASPTFHAPRAGCLIASWGSWLALLVVSLPVEVAVPSRVLRVLVLSCLSLVVAECSLRLAAWIAPSPLFSTMSSGSAARMASYAFAPGELHFGKPTNRLGFFDDPFLPASERHRKAVAVIGDSFSASYVPHDRHYTTVAERLLRDVEVWNVGWAAMGPSEYRAMLERHVLPLLPDAVVVSVFLGNDLLESSSLRGLDRVLADWFDRSNLLVCEVPRRLVRWSEAGWLRAGDMAMRGDLLSAAKWLDDPREEPGAMQEQAFLRVELERAIACSDQPQARWDSLVRELSEMRRAVGPRPFAVALIPDEAMVEDALWQRVSTLAGRPLGRHGLRERMARWCTSEGIPCLDLWLPLSAEPPFQVDGDRRLYLLRDTHWNARGNAVAGRALADFLAGLLRGVR